MKKLLFTIKNNILEVKEKNRLTDEYKNILNTNVISSNELIFSDEYLSNNGKIVATFINELTLDYHIDTLSIDKNEDALLILKLLTNNKAIVSLILKEDAQITFKLCECLVKTGIKNVNCYNLQPFMLEYLDKYKVLVESRNEILYLSNFMLNNNLSIFSSMFYKISLQISLPMSNQDEEDFEAFCKINKYLKIINVSLVNKNDLEYIVDVLRKNNKKNIKIIIHDNISDEEVIEYLKNFNKKKSQRYKIYFKLNYSEDYLEKNLLKQTNNSILNFCGYIIIAIIGFTFAYIFYDNYKSMKSVNKIQDELKEVISITDKDDIIENISKDTNINPDKKIENPDIASIYNINPETVGWLTVPNTNIDYPVVQHNDNAYYLDHNIYFEKDKNGWVFMDYKDDVNILSDNIILYAHNRYYNGVMFGTLQNTMRRSWYTNPDNQLISFKTLYENLNYKIFSMYKIEVTTDYLRILFPDDDTKLEFFNMLKNRSMYDFGVELNKDDKILTLSTCADENNRYVVHAVLQK